MTNSAKSNTDIGTRLRGIAERYEQSGETLRPDVRRRIVNLAIADQTARAARPTAVIWSFLPKMAAAAAVAVILALPAFKMNGPGPVDTKTPIHDFQVTSREGQVVLTWEDGDQPRRVVKATSREELAHLAEMPGVMVKGEKWVDTRPDEAQLVYYFVE